MSDDEVKVRITFRCPARLKKRLVKAARRRHMALSDLILEYLGKQFPKYEENEIPADER